MALLPRDYQLECLEQIKKGNRIINMPTGGGKTLVAVLALASWRVGGWFGSSCPPRK